MNGIEKLLTYATIGMVLWIMLTILLVYSKNYFFDRLIKLTKEQRKLEKDRKEGKSNNINPYYMQCKTQFNLKMKNGSLKRDKVLELKDLIDLLLGDKVRNYNNYQFKNDCHEIYVKLKSEWLNQLDYERILQFLAKN